MNNQAVTLSGFIYREEKDQKNAKHIAHKLGTLLSKKWPALKPAWILSLSFLWDTSQRVVSQLKPSIYKRLGVFGPGPLLNNFFSFREVSRSIFGPKAIQVSNIIKQKEWATALEKCPKNL